MTKPASVLLVDGDAAQVALLEQDLSALGMRVRTAASSLEGYRQLAEHRFEVVVLELALPDQNGETLVSYLRRNTASGIIVLSGRDRVATRVSCYRLGADLFLGKPAHVQELAAAITSLARRVRGTQQMAGQLRELQVDRGWALEVARRVLQSPELRHTALTAGECALLRVLAAQAGRTVSRSTLLEQFYGRSDDSANRALEALVRRVRLKIASVTDGPSPLMTEHGVGYAFAAPILLH